MRAGTCRGIAMVFVCGALLWCAGCRGVPRFGPVNLADSAWTVRQGQAIWKRGRQGPEISGDLMVATRGDGRAFVQFSKNPFPIFAGQSGPGGWQVEIPMEKKRYGGPGRPPKRLLLLYLPRVLAGEPAPKGWRWEKLDGNGWRLASSRESVEVYFFQ